MSDTIRRARWAAVLVALVAMGCNRSVPLRPTTPVALAEPSDPTELRAAIVRALGERRFNTEVDQPGHLVARLDHRRATLRLAIDYDPTGYRITYVDSVGLGHEVGPNGGQRISRNYDRYVHTLQRTIEDEIERPEREAQEAIERERQHQIELAEQERRREQEARDAVARRERDAREAEARERQRDREARVAVEALRTQRAQAEADARRPIIVNHQPTVSAQLAVAPRRRAEARFETIAVNGRGRDEWVTGQAEGRLTAAQLGLPSECRGHFAGTAEHLIDVRRDVGFLRIETDADGDPTLVLVADDGTAYCDDDGAGNGLNSAIEGSFPAGTYRVFVGSYQRGVATHYRLHVSQGR